MGLLKLIGCDDESQLRRIREREEQRQWFLKQKAAREKEWNEEHGISEAAAAYAAPAADSGNGGAVQNALLNMFSTSDLDQIFADCSPRTTQTLYGAANMAQANNLELRAMKGELATDQQYRELKGRYDELHGRYDKLERRYQELQEQQKRLTDILDRMSQSQGR